jgi:hypothetical protein
VVVVLALGGLGYHLASGSSSTSGSGASSTSSLTFCQNVTAGIGALSGGSGNQLGTTQAAMVQAETTAAAKLTALSTSFRAAAAEAPSPAIATALTTVATGATQVAAQWTAAASATAALHDPTPAQVAQGAASAGQASLAFLTQTANAALSPVEAPIKQACPGIGAG